MRKLTAPLTIGAAMFLVSMLVAPAQAQSFHTWVASNGSDASSNCDRATPCKTFQGALTKTSTGGEITCADSGQYGNLTISKSITVNCENAIGSNYLDGNSIGLTSVMTAAGDVVTLRGLDIDGAGLNASSLITFSGAGVLHVDKVKINNIRGGASGISFTPNGPARLDVSDSFIADNGSNVSTAGILIRPTAGGSANVSVSRTDLKGNVNGIYVDGSGGGGAVNLSVRDSLITGSSNTGIAVAGGGAPVTALIDRTTVNYSVNTGVAAAGAAATVRIGNSTISNNVTGVAVFSGAILRSFKNNQIKGNGTDGTPIAADNLD